MAETATVGLSIDVDTSQVDRARQACEALSICAEKAVEALKALGDAKHGGLIIKMVGDTLLCEVLPPKNETTA